MPQNRASTTKLLVDRSISIVEYSSSRNPVGLTRGLYSLVKKDTIYDLEQNCSQKKS